MVTWGANTVHNISGVTGASSVPNTGTTPTTTTGLFGNTTAPTTTPGVAGGFSFAPSNTPTTPLTGGFFGGGSTTPAAPLTGGGLFGSSTATVAAPIGGGLFGSSSFFGGAPTQAPSSGGLFGSSNSNNNTSSIFGGNTSIFGNTTNTTGSVFGSATPTTQQHQQQQLTPQIPAHAALQAHMNAYARNEEARVLQRMQTVHQVYNGTAAATNGKSHCFSIPLYNPITEQQRQLQDAISSIVMTTNNQGFMVSSSLVAPPKPLQISEDDWNLACIRNPDANHFLPTAVVGADSLQARAILHQEQTNTIKKHVAKIQEAIDHIQQRHSEVTRLLEYATEHHQKQRTRLLKIMKAVEVGRCFNIPLQAAEIEAFQRIRYLKRHIIEEQVVPDVLRLTDSRQQQTRQSQQSNKSDVLAITASSTTASNLDRIIPIEKQQIWMTIMKEHRMKIGSMTETLQKEQHDLQLLHDRVIGSGGSSSNTNHNTLK